MAPLSPSRKNGPSSSVSACNPMLIFGAGLFVAQLVIFILGASFVGTGDHTTSHHQGASGMHKLSLQDFQQQSRRRQPIKNKRSSVDPSADGTFNGYPIYLKQRQDPLTLPHCVGENYQEGEAWKRRSCEFQFFCFDTSKKEFVVFQSPTEDKIHALVDDRPFVDISQSYLKVSSNRTNTMSLGGINLKWGNDGDTGIKRLEWFPEIRRVVGETLSYYELPPNIIMVPFHSMNGANPGHLLWDDFLPIYTLLTMFQYDDEQYEAELLMMRYVLKDGRGLWASCDFKDDQREACKKMHKKFLPLMMGPNPVHDLTTTENFDFVVSQGRAHSDLVCAKVGLAGFGALTDHGPTKLHGWEDEDYKITHNHGRGGMLYEFRNFLMLNIGVPSEHNHKPPFRIVFSENSSENQMRNLNFRKQKEVLAKNFDPRYISVESYVFKDIPLVQQVEIASQTTIYISGCGGGAVTATFLPRGASVFLYFLESGGISGGRDNGKPARLDWDLFNNIGYLKVHWLPRGTMHKDDDLRSFVLLVQHELDALMRERTYDKLFY